MSRGDHVEEHGAPRRLAVVFDFDGTLAPDSTTAFLRDAGVNVDAFWGEGVEARVARGWDPVPAYLYGMWRLARDPAHRAMMTRERFRRFGRRMRLFPGVAETFERLRERVRARAPSADVEYYLISSGIGEILRATEVADRFTRISASDFHYDETGTIEFPCNIVSFTDKTRYLFELSKGVGFDGDHATPFDVNRRIPPESLRIPFRNVIFIGDGYTDVPCFEIVRRNGGVAIGVSEPGMEGGPLARSLVEDDRVSDLVAADYRPGSPLSDRIERGLDAMLG
jgi:phosphoserine phosphatase